MNRLELEIEELVEYLKGSVDYILRNPSIYTNDSLDKRILYYNDIMSSHDKLKNLLDQIPSEKKESGKLLIAKIVSNSFHYGAHERNQLYDIFNPDEIIKEFFYNCKLRVDSVINGKIDTTSMDTEQKRTLFNEIKHSIKELKSEYQKNKRSVDPPYGDISCLIFYEIEAFLSSYYYGGDEQKVKKILGITESRLKRYKIDLKKVNR